MSRLPQNAADDAQAGAEGVRSSTFTPGLGRFVVVVNISSVSLQPTSRHRAASLLSLYFHPENDVP